MNSRFHREEKQCKENTLKVIRGKIMIYIKSALQ